MDPTCPRLKRWSARLADREQEQRFRQHTMLLEWRTMLAATVVVLAVDVAAFVWDEMTPAAGVSGVDVAVQAFASAVAAGAGVLLWRWRISGWTGYGVGTTVALAVLVTVLIATGHNMRLQGALLLVGGVMLIYLAMRFNLIWVTSIAVGYSAMVIPAWLVAARGIGRADLYFTLAIVVVEHWFGFVEARRMQQERRLLFAQRDLLSKLSTRDELTGLGNRRHFYAALDKQLPVARAAGKPVAVILVDLDRFKEINDSLGHQAGDTLLKEIAQRLQATLPDAHALARLGGDEYVALLRDYGRGSTALTGAERFLAALEDPVAVDGLHIHVRASIGIAVSSDPGEDRAILLRHADVAMYQAKARGGGIEVYAPDHDTHTRDRVALASDLATALTTNSDQIVLYYQPKADLATGAVQSVEALIRWQHPVHGLLAPVAFLRLAEQHGLMHQLTLRVLTLALHQAAAWRDAGRPLRIAVNLAPANLLDTRFPDEVAALVQQAGVSTDLLQLEITENTLLVDPDRILGVINRLGQLGFTFALDDYGTGYSSLAYLRLLPVTELKIDQSFVSTMIDNPNDAIIVRSTIDLARNLGFHVVAEGVEDPRTWNQLAAYGCDTAQGYFLSRPLPAHTLHAWLDTRCPTATPSVGTPSACRPDRPGHHYPTAHDTILSPPARSTSRA